MNTKTIISSLMGIALLLSCSNVKTDSVITAGEKSGDYIILTNDITQGEEFHGYEQHNIPLKIYISEGKIAKIEAYDHLESPDFFADVEQQLLPQWVGLSVEEALAKQPDAVSGATYSSKAVIKSVQAGLEYAKKEGIK